MIRNIHERHIAASPDAVGELLETLGSPGDRMWRTRLGMPVVLDAGLAVGSTGGHSDVRYHVVEHEPRRSVVLDFDPPFGCRGGHRFDVVPLPDGTTVLRHTLWGELTGSMRWLWPVLVRPAHDTVVEDIHDHVERTLTGTAHRVQPPAPHLVLLAPLLSRRTVRPVPLPAASLIRGSLPRVDAGDAWGVPLDPADSRDVDVWRTAVFTSAPRWVVGLMRLRERLARLVGLEPVSGSGERGFPVLGRGDGEVLLGLDDRHLSFRTAVVVQEDAVVVPTVVQVHNRLGRLYWAVVRLFHPVVVRALLRRVPRPLTGTAVATAERVG